MVTGEIRKPSRVVMEASRRFQPAGGYSSVFWNFGAIRILRSTSAPVDWEKVSSEGSAGCSTPWQDAGLVYDSSTRNPLMLLWNLIIAHFGGKVKGGKGGWVRGWVRGWCSGLGGSFHQPINAAVAFRPPPALALALTCQASVGSFSSA